MNPIKVMRRGGVGTPVETTYLASTTVIAPSSGTYQMHCFGGGGGTRTTIASIPGGGAGGGYSKKNSLPVAGGQALTLTVGAAGTNHTTTPTKGGDTSVVFASVTQCLATGGGVNGGTNDNTTNGIGDVKYNGGQGGMGQQWTDPEPPNATFTAVGGGGGGAGSGSNGGAGGFGIAAGGEATDGEGGTGGTGTYPGGRGAGNGVASAVPGGGASFSGGAASAGKIVLIFTPS